MTDTSDDGIPLPEFLRGMAVILATIARDERPDYVRFVMNQFELTPEDFAAASVVPADLAVRYPYEVRDQSDHFDDIPDEEIPKDMLDLAVHIVKTKSAEFDPSSWRDHYEEAVLDIIKRKQKGETITAAPPPTGPAKVINLMDALRRSVEGAGEAFDKAEEGELEVLAAAG